MTKDLNDSTTISECLVESARRFCLILLVFVTWTRNKFTTIFAVFKESISNWVILCFHEATRQLGHWTAVQLEINVPWTSWLGWFLRSRRWKRINNTFCTCWMNESWINTDDWTQLRSSLLYPPDFSSLWSSQVQAPTAFLLAGANPPPPSPKISPTLHFRTFCSEFLFFFFSYVVRRYREPFSDIWSRRHTAAAAGSLCRGPRGLAQVKAEAPRRFFFSWCFTLFYSSNFHLNTLASRNWWET